MDLALSPRLPSLTTKMSVLSGASLKRGWRTDSENGETHLYGIPLDQLPGLGQYFYVEDGFACVLAFGKNVDSSLEFLRILCRDMLAAPAADGP